MNFSLDEVDVWARKVLSLVFFLLGWGSALILLIHTWWMTFEKSVHALSPIEIGLNLVPSGICIMLWLVLRIDKMVGPAWAALTALLELSSKAFAQSPSMVVFLTLVVLGVVFVVLRDVTKAEIYGDIASLFGGALGSRAVEKAVDGLKPKITHKRSKVEIPT